ncbi:MAG: hypothetical protein KA998_03185 [Rickettsiaceae bacterium]|nr:hypothetical protein [Rickettsiaceae bacterium]
MPLVIIFIYCIFAALNANAEAWIPRKNHFKFKSSFYSMDKPSLKNSKKNSEKYYEIDRKIEKEIPEYYDLLLNNPGATPDQKDHLLQEKAEQIKNAKRYQANFEAFYRTKLITQSIEYGITDDQSVGINANLTKLENYNKDSETANDIELFHKLRIYEDKKYIISIRSLLGKSKKYMDENEKYGELRLMVGKLSKNKLGGTLFCTEIGYKQFTNGKYSIHLDQTMAAETKAGVTIMIEAFSSFEPRALPIWRKRIFKQFSLAKSFKLSNSEDQKFTIKAGYFSEYSIIARKDMYSGLVASLYMEF